MQQAAELWTNWTQRRDERSFEALVRAELPHALWFARRLGCGAADAEDAVQEALARLVAVRDDSPATIGLRAWIFREVHVRARSRLRSERRRKAREAIAQTGATSSAPDAPASVRDEVDRALAELDADERIAVELRFLHDLDYHQVATTLGVSEGACRQRVHKAITRLRARFGGDAAAVLAAFPLPLVGDAKALVRRAIAEAPTASAAAVGGVTAVAATSQKAILATAIAAALAVAVGVGVSATPGGTRTSAQSPGQDLTLPASAAASRRAPATAPGATTKRSRAAAVADPPQMGPPQPEPPDPARAAVGDPGVDPVHAALDRIDWDAFAKAALQGRQGKREPLTTPDAAALEQLARFTRGLEDLAPRLGTRSLDETSRSPAVQARIAAAIARALKPGVTPAELAPLTTGVETLVRSQPSHAPEAPRLVSLARDLELSDGLRNLVAGVVGADAARQLGDLHLGSASPPRFSRAFVVGATEDEVASSLTAAMAQALGRADLGEPEASIVRDWCSDLLDLQRKIEAEYGQDAAQALLRSSRRSSEAATRYREREDFPDVARSVQRRITAAQARAHGRLAEVTDDPGRAALRRDQPTIYYAYVTRD